MKSGNKSHSFISPTRRQSGSIILIPAIAAALTLAGCVVPKQPVAPSKTPVAKTEHINNETKFSQAEYGAASPRVTSDKRTRKGGGRFQIGKPYQVRGKWYKPKEDPNLEQIGFASWYGPNFHGRLTANGEIYDQYGISAAHPTMPLPSYAYVTNLENGRKIKVRVNDRGPYAHGRVIDLSAQAAKLLGYDRQGVAKVKVQYAGLAAMDGLDEKMLLATYVGPGDNRLGVPGSFDGNNDAGSGTMIAMAAPIVPTGAAAAINQSFAPTLASLSGGIPVPTVRPTLFEGIPLAQNDTGNSLISDVERVVYRPVQSTVTGNPPRPMAYWDDTPELEKLAYARMALEDDAAKPFGDAPVTIELGTFADQTSLFVLNHLLAEAGKVIEGNAAGRLALQTTEVHANQALAYAHSIGLVTAFIR